VGRVTWHQFRHIHSSLLNDLRVPVKIAQEQLGHASISTTLGIYTHVVDPSHRSAVEAVEERLFVESVSNCLESADGLKNAPPVSSSVNYFRLDAPPGFEPGMEVLQTYGVDGAPQATKRTASRVLSVRPCQPAMSVWEFC
jgi:Phage integrase family